MRWLAVILLVLLAGCYQDVWLRSDPPGAKVVVHKHISAAFGDDRIELRGEGVTPYKLSLKRTESMIVRFDINGVTAEKEIDSRFSLATYLLTLTLAGHCGACWYWPEEVYAEVTHSGGIRIAETW